MSLLLPLFLLDISLLICTLCALAVGVIVSMVMLDNDLASLFTLRYIKTLFVLIIASADLTETHLRYHRCALSLIADLSVRILVF